MNTGFVVDPSRKVSKVIWLWRRKLTWSCSPPESQAAHSSRPQQMASHFVELVQQRNPWEGVGSSAYHVLEVLESFRVGLIQLGLVHVKLKRTHAQ